MECWTQTISNSCISMFRGWMRFIRLGVVILLSLNKPRTRRMSISCGVHSWPWKRWYPMTWRWDPSSHPWDLTATTLGSHFSVSAALCSSLVTKRGAQDFYSRKCFIQILFFLCSKLGEWDQVTSIPYSRFVSQSRTQYFHHIYPSWFSTF